MKTIRLKTNPSKLIMLIKNFPSRRNISLTLEKVMRIKLSAFAKLKIVSKLGLVVICQERICMKFIANRSKRRNGRRSKLSPQFTMKTI